MNTCELNADILVAGGGPAGVPCALAAARSGAKVILCQDRSMLGGNASSEVRMHIVGADGGRKGRELAVEAREGGIIEEIRLETCVRNRQRSAAMLDLILYELCRAEPNLTLLLDTAVTGAQRDGRFISHAIAERQSTEDRFIIKSKVFVDCTGDGRLGAEAGASFVMGREAKSEYGESLAQDLADNKTLGSTILFEARKHPHPIPFVAPKWARKFTEEDLRHRPHATAGIDNGLEYGYWWVEWGGELDTIKDNARIRDELLAIVMGVWDHIKNGGNHGADNWALDWFGFLPAKRESRRFLGQHVLTETDVLTSRPFSDAIAFGGWPIDTHPPRGIDADDEEPCTKTRVPNIYDIPLRSCISRDIDNLMFAGRNISSTHIAFASTRVMATCAAVGQGVGTAAAHAAASGTAPALLPDDQALLRSIQQSLIRNDAYLIGVTNEDSSDLARRAIITASSEQPGGDARNVISGQTRSVNGEEGAPARRAIPGSHRWMSDPADQLPAWLELKWDSPVSLREIRIVFDTGMHRVLTLSHSDDYVRKMHWGSAQPETVRDYTLLVQISGDWVSLATVRNNYQRLRIHVLPKAATVTALRILVEATNGIDHARIMEVRAY